MFDFKILKVPHLKKNIKCFEMFLEFPPERIKFLIFKFLRSGAIQHAMTLEIGGKWEMKCLNTTSLCGIQYESDFQVWVRSMGSLAW